MSQLTGTYVRDYGTVPDSSTLLSRRDKDITIFGVYYICIEEHRRVGKCASMPTVADGSELFSALRGTTNLHRDLALSCPSALPQ